MLALSKYNTNAAEIILFLHRLTQVLIEYFKELEEESIRDNFVVIYELLDEVMDFGYPQTTESKILQELVIILVLYRVRKYMDVHSCTDCRINAGISLKSRTNSMLSPLLPP